jgi:2-polyprenyl-6-hydroxyphenyl methylase/3-demethylubiquinone-9 3-methyltransferase
MNEERNAGAESEGPETRWDHSSHQHFLEYYAQESQSPETLQRFSVVQNAILRTAARVGLGHGPFEVADIGCGAGTQCRMWARPAGIISMESISISLW